MELTRYWITFQPAVRTPFLNLGCGAAALGKSDALTLLENALGKELPPLDIFMRRRLKNFPKG